VFTGFSIILNLALATNFNLDGRESYRHTSTTQSVDSERPDGATGAGGAHVTEDMLTARDETQPIDHSFSLLVSAESVVLGKAHLSDLRTDFQSSLLVERFDVLSAR